MPHHRLDAERIGELFQAVDAGLHGAGLRSPVEIVVVGGAAIALQWNRARTTYDVDVVSEGIPSAFWRVVEAVGRDEGLEDGWLNAAARVKAPPGPTPGEPRSVYLGSNLRVYGASAHYVLAMKLLAGRETDRADTPTLLEAPSRRARTSCTTFDGDQAYPAAQIPASTSYIIDQVWEDHIRSHPELARSEGGRPVGVHVRPFPLDDRD